MSHEKEGRSVELEIALDVPASVVWRALTDAEELRRWFPADARVEPGVGGSIWFSWGPGVEGASSIAIWDPEARLRLVERWGEGDGAVEFAMDFFITALSGERATLRLVHSGFSNDASWDEQYTAMEAGWTYFFRNLKHYLERHLGMPRVLVWERRVAGTTRDASWRVMLSLVGGHVPAQDATVTIDVGTGPHQAIVEVLVASRALALRLPDLHDSMLFVEFESGAEKWHCGVWLSTYGVSEETVAALRPGVQNIAKQLCEGVLAGT
jgi:uncharacterized protein YndB with AHSA1/START domain